jgi:hypothetical protein
MRRGIPEAEREREALRKSVAVPVAPKSRMAERFRSGLEMERPLSQEMKLRRTL